MLLNRKGTLLLVSCSDKVIRMLEVKQRPPGAKLYSQEELKEALATVEVSKNRTHSLLALIISLLERMTIYPVQNQMFVAKSVRDCSCT